MCHATATRLGACSHVHPTTAAHAPYCVLPVLLQVKQRYDAMLAEMTAFSQERDSWQAGRAAADAQLAEARQRFEAAARAQVGCPPAC